VKELKSTLQKFYSDDASISYDYGKIINENRFDKLLGYLKEGKILHGGKHDRESLFIEPSIVDEVKPEDKIMQEEIFGPILPILSYNSTDEAMQIVKKNYQPLALYLFTTNKKTENEWMKKISFGGGCINNTLWHFANSNLPFGGIGNSGTGAYHGKFSFNTFTHAKPVLKTPSWPDPSLRYPPMKGKLKWFKKLVR
nr:aldehyde dehydrogenase family protein [Chitinophagaceae bacterium]